MKRYALRLRLLGAALLALLAALAWSAWRGDALLDARLRSQIEQRVAQTGPLLNAALALPIAQRDYSTIRDLLHRLREEKAVDYLVVLDHSGRAMDAVGWDPAVPLPAADTRFDLGERTRHHAAQPVLFGAQPYGELRYGISLAAQRETHDAQRRQWLEAGTLSLLIAVGLFAPAGVFLMRRLRRLEDGAERLAAGDLSARVRESGEDEVGRLAGAFNRMADALAERIAQLDASESRLSELLSEYRSLVNNALVGIAHVRDHAVVTCNRRFEEMFGLPPGGGPGTATRRLYTQQADYDAQDSIGHQVLASGHSYSSEILMQRGDASTFLCFLHGRALDPADPPHGSIWIYQDVSDRKRALDALRAEKRFADAVIDALPGIFYLAELDGRLVRWNANLPRVTGLDDAAMGGMTIYDRLPERFRADTAKLARDVVDRHIRWQGEIRLLAADGREIPYIATLESVDRADGTPLLMGTGVDIGDRKNAEREIRRINETLEQRVAARTADLEATNRELEAFSYSVSHDLSAPLRSIDGFARIIEEDYGRHMDADGRASLERIRAASRRMHQIIDDMLSLSRITRNEMTIEPVDLSALAAAVLGELAAAHPERRVEIHVAPGLQARGDAGLLRRALENLLGNAWKFTARTEGARIAFGRLPGAGEAVYFVRDNGAGFDMRFAEKLFSAFQRLHPPGEFDGSGIGLAIVSRAIARHGGRIWAEAEPGRGATFCFTLRP